MSVGQKIEKIRLEQNIPVFKMCDILAITSQAEYHKIINGRISLTIYQRIMFISSTCSSLD
ncbi:MAG: hypothetical protein E7011_02800 [Alphaproteobacteria bacterium]|nr:hypothetical protein [Alphaproteobacteria bacterium]